MSLNKQIIKSFIVIFSLLILSGCATTTAVVGNNYLEQRKVIANNFEVDFINELNKVKELRGEPNKKIISINNKLDEQPANKYKKYNPFDPQVQKLGY